jgi:type III secretion system FlhB-like substrate exporter
MNYWFTVKVKYTKQLDNGALKRVSEPYLVAAMTFTDAEARIYEELGQVIRGEFNVVGITRTELHDIFIYDDADVWYKVKVKYETADADSEKAKKVTQNFLVTANSVKEAYERIKESLSTLLVDFEIPSIVVSPIVEIFPFAENLDKEIDRRPMNEIESSEEQPNGGAVFSASGSDEDDSEESEIEDVTSKDE